MQKLQASPRASVLGSDMYNRHAASTSLAQGLDVPPASIVANLRPDFVHERACDYMLRIGIHECKHRQYLERFCHLFTAMGGWTFEYASAVCPSMTSMSSQLDEKHCVKVLTALIHLLQMASFAFLPPAFSIAELPSRDTLSLGNYIPKTSDPTSFEHSIAAKKQLKTEILRSDTCFRFSFRAKRGVASVGESGLLLP